MNRSYTHQSWSMIPPLVISQIVGKIRIVHTGFWLLLTIPIWLTIETITPGIVRADIARVNLTIDPLPNETYESMLQRAEITARAATQRIFDKDILVANVSVVIIVNNYGAIAPVLQLKVSRGEWRQRPDPHRWVKHFKNAKSLLVWTEPPITNSPVFTPPPPTNVNNDQFQPNPNIRGGNPRGNQPGIENPGSGIGDR